MDLDDAYILLYCENLCSDVPCVSASAATLGVWEINVGAKLIGLSIQFENCTRLS